MPSNLNSDGSLMAARTEAIEWMLRVIAHYGFTGRTIVLAVNYLDRFISSIRFQIYKPWMSQLGAAACLSLTAKVEETQLPLLLELQVEESKYVFEAKTIQRMEEEPRDPTFVHCHISRRLGLSPISV